MTIRGLLAWLLAAAIVLPITCSHDSARDFDPDPPALGDRWSEHNE